MDGCVVENPIVAQLVCHPPSEGGYTAQPDTHHSSSLSHSATRAAMGCGKVFAGSTALVVALCLHAVAAPWGYWFPQNNLTWAWSLQEWGHRSTQVHWEQQIFAADLTVGPSAVSLHFEADVDIPGIVVHKYSFVTSTFLCSDIEWTILGKPVHLDAFYPPGSDECTGGMVTLALVGLGSFLLLLGAIVTLCSRQGHPCGKTLVVLGALCAIGSGPCFDAAFIAKANQQLPGDKQTQMPASASDTLEIGWTLWFASGLGTLALLASCANKRPPAQQGFGGGGGMRAAFLPQQQYGTQY
jgi:hypothetical protein